MPKEKQIIDDLVDTDIKYKRCYYCKEVLPYTDFFECKSRYDGLSSWCKKCRGIIYKKIYDRRIKLLLPNVRRKKNDKQKDIK